MKSHKRGDQVAAGDGTLGGRLPQLGRARQQLPAGNPTTVSVAIPVTQPSPIRTAMTHTLHLHPPVVLVSACEPSLVSICYAACTV